MSRDPDLVREGAVQREIFWEKVVSSGKNSRCKGPEARICLAYQRNQEKPVLLKQSAEVLIGDEVRSCQGPNKYGLTSQRRETGFYF